MKISTPFLLALLAATAPLAATSAHAESAATAASPTRGLYLQLIRQARADGRARAAIAYLDDFDRQFPRDRDAALLRINSLLDLGQVDQAEATLNQIDRGQIDRNASKDGAVRDMGATDAVRGHVAAARGRWDAAVPFYAAAVAADPTAPLLRNALGYALLRAHQPDRAIEALRGAADLAPGDAVIRNNLILAYTMGGNKDAAADAIARSGDRKAQADLRRQIVAEAARIATPAPVAALPATKATTLAATAPISAPSRKQDR